MISQVDDDSHPPPASIPRKSGGRQAAQAAVSAYAPAVADGGRTVVLVEGMSDHAALTALAARSGRELHDEGVSIVPMGGATNIGHFLDVLGPRGLDVRLAGLCDLAEEPGFRRSLRRAGLSSDPDRGGMERAGFFVCVTDLEDELIRSLGEACTEQVIEAQGELASFRILQNQPAQRNRTRDQQLHRFMGSRGGRKIHYARVLAETLDLSRVPEPLDRLLAFV
jgi:OLD-like protein